MKVYIVYEMAMPVDRMRAIWTTQKGAEDDADKRSKRNPKADGFYVEDFEVQE